MSMLVTALCGLSVMLVTALCGLTVMTATALLERCDELERCVRDVRQGSGNRRSAWCRTRPAKKGSRWGRLTQYSGI